MLKLPIEALTLKSNPAESEILTQTKNTALERSKADVFLLRRAGVNRIKHQLGIAQKATAIRKADG